MRKRLRTRLKESGNYADLFGTDPVGFIEVVLDEHPWSIQKRIAEAVRDYPNVAVPSCFGSGKDWIAARLLAWWVTTGGVAITTADTYRQVRDILWRELRRAHRAGDLRGTIPAVESRWELPEGEFFAIGIKPDDYNPEGFQGIHAKKVLVVIDEANGVSEELFTASKGLVVNQASRILAIGNPYEPAGPFFEACKSATWHVIPISVFDTPNFTGEPVPEKAKDELVGPFWLDQRRAEGLEGTPWWQAKVLGQFPESSSDQVIPLAHVERARTTEAVTDGREAAGLDVARFGTDRTVLVEASGNGPDLITILQGHDTMAVAGLAARFLSDRRGSLAVDDGGVGGGVVDRLREQRLPGAVIANNAGSAPDDDPEERLLNMRSQLWWHAREAFYRGEISLARLPEDQYQTLRSELTAPTYRFTSNGKVQIESKEELKKRGVPSPDVADAFCLWLYARSRARRRVSFGAVA